MTENPPKRPRGRPPLPQGAKLRAEVQHDYRERKASRIQSAWALKLELCEQEVARLTAQNASLEKELKALKRLEQNRSDERKASMGRLQVQAAAKVKRPS